jgi:phage prohead protease, HK97 family
MPESKRYTMPFDIKASDDSTGTLTGILSTYGNVDFANDICMPGCFNRSVKEKGKIRPMLWSHDHNEPIGRLEITDTEGALTVKGFFNMNVQRGAEAFHLVKAGDVQGLSIGYTVVDWDYDGEGHRLLKDIDLWEGSVVVFPANPLAYAEAKNMTENKSKIRMRFAQKAAIKELDDEERDEILKALDEVLDEEDEQKAEDDPEEPSEEPKKKKGQKEDDEGEDEEKEDDEDEEELKAALNGAGAEAKLFTKEMKAWKQKT